MMQRAVPFQRCLDDMSKVRNDLWQDEQAKNKAIGWGFGLDWITDIFRNAFGNIFGPILKLLLPVIVTMLIVAIVIGCVIKCIRASRGRLVRSIVGEEEEDPLYEQLHPAERIQLHPINRLESHYRNVEN